MKVHHIIQCHKKIHCDFCKTNQEWKKNICASLGIDDFSCPTEETRNIASCSEAEEHVTWCSRYNFPTDEEFCKTCSNEMKKRNAEAIRWINQMRQKGINFSKTPCEHHKDTGQQTEKKCCGGRIKTVPIYHCTLFDKPNPQCMGCKRKLK